MTGYQTQTGEERDLFGEILHKEEFTEASAPNDSSLDELMQIIKRLSNPAEIRLLLQSVVRHKNIGPYNAMLIHIQRPDAENVMSATDWLELGRQPKPDATPLIILKPFGPVAFVFDYRDTEGDELPKDHQLSLLPENPFGAKGQMPNSKLNEFYKHCAKVGIHVKNIGCNVNLAGRLTYAKRQTCEITINNAHPANARFSALCHELAHFYCGHLCDCKELGVKFKEKPHNVQEIEAELSAFLVCKRLGIDIASAEYLVAHFTKEAAKDFSFDAIILAAGKVEATLLGKMPWKNPNSKLKQKGELER